MKMRTARLQNGIFIDLSFVRPWQADNQVEFKFEPGPAGTRVTWAMHGPQPFLARAMGLFVSTDKLVGPDFEKGLMNLKRTAEAEAAADKPAEPPKSGGVAGSHPVS